MTPSNYNSIVKYAGLGKLMQSGINKLVSLLGNDKKFQRYVNDMYPDSRNYMDYIKSAKIRPDGTSFDIYTGTLKPGELVKFLKKLEEAKKQKVEDLSNLVETMNKQSK